MPMVDTQLDELLHRLARVQPPPAPVISLYLNTQADERGRDRFRIVAPREVQGASIPIHQRSRHKDFRRRLRIQEFSQRPPRAATRSR